MVGTVIPSEQEGLLAVATACAAGFGAIGAGETGVLEITGTVGIPGTIFDASSSDSQ